MTLNYYKSRVLEMSFKIKDYVLESYSNLVYLRFTLTDVEITALYMGTFQVYFIQGVQNY